MLRWEVLQKPSDPSFSFLVSSSDPLFSFLLFFFNYSTEDEERKWWTLSYCNKKYGIEWRWRWEDSFYFSFSRWFSCCSDTRCEEWWCYPFLVLIQYLLFSSLSSEMSRIDTLLFWTGTLEIDSVISALYELIFQMSLLDDVTKRRFGSLFLPAGDSLNLFSLNVYFSLSFCLFYWNWYQEEFLILMWGGPDESRIESELILMIIENDDNSAGD